MSSNVWIPYKCITCIEAEVEHLQPRVDVPRVCPVAPERPAVRQLHRKYGFHVGWRDWQLTSRVQHEVKREPDVVREVNLCDLVATEV